MREIKTDIRQAVEHMPPASVLILDGVTWEEYEELLEDLDDRPGVRITYDCGRLEIVTPSRGHEARKEMILRMVHILSEELRLDVEAVGGTTQKRKRDQKGTSPDTSFYIGNVERITDMEELNLEKDPPPDVVVEIDKSNQSLSKFPIYATFGVSEIWRYDIRRKRAQIYTLHGDSYVETPASVFFPILTSSALYEFVERSKTHRQTAALAAFRKWIRRQLRK